MSAIPATGERVTAADLRFTLEEVLPGVDGHQRDAPEARAWMTAAEDGGWSRAQLASALRTVCRTFTGFRIMPGHVEEQVRTDAAKVRDRWDCPPPPRELADDPRAEIAWRRRAFADYRDRALVAMAGGESLTDVPLTLSPEPGPPAVGRLVRAEIEQRGWGRSVPDGDAEPKRPGAPPSALDRARARARVEGHRPVSRASRQREGRAEQARAELDARRRSPVDDSATEGTRDPGDEALPQVDAERKSA